MQTAVKHPTIADIAHQNNELTEKTIFSWVVYCSKSCDPSKRYGNRSTMVRLTLCMGDLLNSPYFDVTIPVTGHST